MGGANVKNTIVERVLQVVAPHPCSGCGKVGSILCPDCKNDISEEPFVGCMLCGAPEPSGICWTHRSPISRTFIVGQREGALEDCINRLKFHNTKAAARTLAELLDESLPLLPSDIYIVPVPTVTAHIRQRGYDQVELIVRQLAGLRHLQVVRPLRRVSKATQHTVGRAARRTQSEVAFALRPDVAIAGRTVLLVDDVVTTGATLSAAATILSDAGATVWVAACAYQPLD